MDFFGTILGSIMSKECKLLNPKKIHSIVQMHALTNPQHIHGFNGHGLVLPLVQ